MRNYVLGFMFNADRSEVVLTRKAKPAWRAGRLNGVGGKIEAGERPLAAMVREFAEGTGFRTCAQDWQRYAMMYWDGADAFTVHVFRSFQHRPTLMDCVPSTTGAEIDVWPDWQMPEPWDSVSNLAWLIEMARDTNPGDCPAYEIRAMIGAVDAPQFARDRPSWAIRVYTKNPRKTGTTPTGKEGKDMGEQQLERGWWRPPNTRKAHYMMGNRSLCGKWARLGKPRPGLYEDSSHDSHVNCAECRRLRERLTAK